MTGRFFCILIFSFCVMLWVLSISNTQIVWFKQSKFYNICTEIEVKLVLIADNIFIISLIFCFAIRYCSIEDLHRSCTPCTNQVQLEYNIKIQQIFSLLLDHQMHCDIEQSHSSSLQFQHISSLFSFMRFFINFF